MSAIPYAKIFGEASVQTTLSAFLDDSARNMTLASPLRDTGAAFSDTPPRYYLCFEIKSA